MSSEDTGTGQHLHRVADGIVALSVTLSLTLQSLLFWKKQGFFPQTSKGFSLRRTPKILGNERKNAQKSKENRKTKKARKSKKSKDWRVRDSASGDSISCDAPYSAIGFRGKLSLRWPPLLGCLWIAIGHFQGKKWGCSSDSLRYHTLTTHTPLIQGWNFTPLIKGVGLKEHSTVGTEIMADPEKDSRNKFLINY